MANRSLNCGYIGQNNLIDGVAPFTSIQLNSRFNQISCPSLASPTKTRTVRAALCDSEWAIRTKSYRTVHFPSDSVRLALENFERGGDSARKCSVRFGTVRGCTPSLPYIVGESYHTVHSPIDSVRLALENFERGPDSARKCSVRFGTVRGSVLKT